MRVLLCLLSRQHVPNLLSVHHYRPDQLVLIESREMRNAKAADSFLEALKLGGLDYSDRRHVEPIDAEDDLDAVRYALQSVQGRFQSGGVEWVVNLTGGTKPMSIATYEFFKGRGKLIYANGARPGHFLDLDGGSTEEECAHRLSIEEFLTGYGFKQGKSPDKLAEAERRARRWARSANLLAQRDDDAAILLISDRERNSARERGTTLRADQFAFPNEELRREWVGDAPEVALDRHQAEFLTGGWLEAFLWSLLDRHSRELGVWDPRISLVVRNDKGDVDNELDVAFMHKHGLSVIECKTGSQDHDAGGASALYKLEAIVRQIRALRIRSYFASTSNNVFDKNGNVRKSLTDRAALYDCRVVSRKQIRELAAHADDVEKVRKLLSLGHGSEVQA